MEYISLFIFIFAIILLMFGYPVAITLASTGLLFALLGIVLGLFDVSFLMSIPNRFYTIITNETLLAVPLFIFMGAVLEKSNMAAELLETMGLLFGSLRGGLAISVVLIGMLLAASTGIVGATIVTMGLISLPTMIKRSYDPKVATGIICASGTLGQIIPPSIVLVILGDVISSAYQKTQIQAGNFAPESVTVGDLFLGALFPGLLLVVLYIGYISILSIIRPHSLPAIPKSERDKYSRSLLLAKVFRVLVPPIILILLVLGSIIGGFAVPTEAAAVGAVGAIIMSLIKRQLTLRVLKEVVYNTTFQTSMIFFILFGASVFSLVFRGYGGDELVRNILTSLPGESIFVPFIIVMLIMFLLGFFIDFIEITLIIVPVVAPILISLGMNPLWLGVLIAINLQTSFLTPPFGFSLFYLRGIAPESIKTSEIYRGVVPFIIIQLIVLLIIYFVPSMVTYLPTWVYGGG